MMKIHQEGQGEKSESGKGSGYKLVSKLRKKKKKKKKKKKVFDEFHAKHGRLVSLLMGKSGRGKKSLHLGKNYSVRRGVGRGDDR